MGRRNSEGVLITVLLLCFVAVALWLSSRNDMSHEFNPPMSTYSPKPEGTKAFYELAVSAGFELQQFHDSEYDYPEDGAVVILDSPDIQLSVLLGGALNATALRLWIEQGGRLLLFSTPMRGLGPDLFNELDRAEGLETEDFDFWDLSQVQGGQASGGNHRVVDPLVVAKQLQTGGTAGQPAALWSVYNPGIIYELPTPRPPLWTDVREIEVADAYIPAVNGHVLLATSPAVDPVAVYRRFGAGEVIWVPRPEIATNSWLDRADNHRFVLALLDFIAAGKTIYVDEHIHGFNRQRATALGLLFGTGGGRLILVLCAVVMMFFLGAAVRPARFLPRAIPPRRQATEMVLAQADLYRRAGAWRNVADSLVDGVKRACMLAFHEPRPMSNRELTGWLKTHCEAESSPCTVMLRYLEHRGELRPRDIVELARECDNVQSSLEAGGGRAH